MAKSLIFQPFSGAGIVSMYPLSGAAARIGVDMGEVPQFTISQQAPVQEMNTSRSADRGLAFRMAQSKAANVTMKLKTLSDPVLEMITSGAWTDVAAASAVVAYALPEGLAVGNLVRLPAKNVSAVAVKDSSGSPKTLTAGTNYELDPLAGVIRITNIATGGPFVQPFKVDYTPGAVSVLGAFQAADIEWGVLFSGVNAHNGDKVVLEGYKFRFAADGDAEWISEGPYGEWTLKGALLKDETRAANAAGGQYYSLTKVNA